LLQNHRRQSERVLGAMSQGHKVQETINRLRNGETLETIADWLEQTAIRAMGSAQNITKFPQSVNNSAFDHTLRMAESVGNYMGLGGSDVSDDLSGGQTWSPWPTPESPYPHSTPVYSGPGEDAMNWTSDLQSQQPNSDAPPASSRPLVGFWSQRPVSAEEVQLSRGLGQQQILGPAYREHPSRPGSPNGTWTEVTKDLHLVEHLMALYFCWEYPTFASLSKEHFVTDFRAGIPRYCSSLLVNAMLALGCRFSDLPQSRGDPTDPGTSGDQFFAEAKRLLAEDDHSSLTTIQAIGLMSIREASCGRDTESFYYAGQAIRLAVEAGLHLEVNGQTAEFEQHGGEGVRSATFWGAFALDQ
jgi:Fungal specific transcription factor domain